MNLGIERAQYTNSTRIARLADGTASVVARVGAGTGHVEIFVVGPRSRALFKRVSGEPALSIRVRPGHVRRAIGVPVIERMNRIVDVDALWGNFGCRLKDELSRSDLPLRSSVLERALVCRARSTREPETANLARKALV